MVEPQLSSDSRRSGVERSGVEIVDKKFPSCNKWHTKTISGLDEEGMCNRVEGSGDN